MRLARMIELPTEHGPLVLVGFAAPWDGGEPKGAGRESGGRNGGTIYARAYIELCKNESESENESENKNKVSTFYKGSMYHDAHL